ncbi:phosphodiesterase [Modestobacter sp. VKM Ac-2983]|uniref:phosphodiesterase n=1 Tax=Modestobacter sp. VKM Ac-2983 TaxID=3004137 RepID=UPI0022AB9745|nr:phosphodiesterase [Modestobacter sp. VKM Ac-2983]MCZ2804767.1 phosphodiesterase [Modestobacter sp. VKM Ac-2983]
MVHVAEVAGRAAAVPFAALARVRRAKPLHPRGVLFAARMERWGLLRETGVPWLHARGTDDVLVRLSRGAGLPPPLPDLLGCAVRLPGAQPVDLLLSSTGSGPWGRQVPVLRRDAGCRYGSIMAFRSTAGPVRLTAVPEWSGLSSDRAGLVARGPGLPIALCAAIGRGPAEPFARITLLRPTDPPDPAVHFDPVLHAPPGLAADGPMARFRRPAYAAARAARGELLPDDVPAREAGPW